MDSSQRRSTTGLRSERGQIAIFIALIFQVLFVFFAMIVNIGLIVHDKINLQNSVDLAAYYAAQRQAEVLNAIAHQNYQIRQAWKLLAFRIRVLGDLGYRNHPMQDQFQGANAEVRAFGAERVPVICLNHGMWGSNQNLCYRESTNIPDLPAYNIINVFSPFNYIFRAVNNSLRSAADNDGRHTGPLNFGIAIRWAAAYRVQVAASKGAIREYANLLSVSTNDFMDLTNVSVKEGARKTLENNLTRSNLKSIRESSNSFRIFNSLGSTGSYKGWLNEVPIYPLIFYVDLIKNAGGWSGQSKIINGIGGVNRPHYDDTPKPDEDVYRNEPMNTDDLYHSVFGVEKNPWQMASVGVYAETSPRKPYLPFGKPIKLKAKAFAKPFGGKIGPWYYRAWPRHSSQSMGAGLEDRVDSLAPIPIPPEGKLEQVPPNFQQFAVPNYSRFPGDKLGLQSLAALSRFKSALIAAYKSRSGISPMAYGAVPAGIDGLAMAPQDQTSINDSSVLGFRAPWIREFETAAIAPDLFDTTYYSIDINSHKNHIEPAFNSKVLSQQVTDIGSFGTILKNPADLILVSQKFAPQGTWEIKDKNHLLTGWAPSGPFEYTFPSVFGKCYIEGKENVPGKCASGGRTGYSVKIVSEDYLRSTNLPLGGQGNVGPIRNPPPNGF